MKTFLRFSLLAAVLAFALPMFAQESDPSGGDSIVSTVVGLLSGIFGTKLAGFFGTVATISGFCALTLKPIWDKFVYPALTAYVQSTASTKDDAWLAALLQNKFVKGILYVLNLVSHIKIPIIDKDGAAVSPSSASTTLPPS